MSKKVVHLVSLTYLLSLSTITVSMQHQKKSQPEQICAKSEIDKRLFEAIDAHDLNQVTLLLDQDANVDAVDENGQTPLGSAIKQGHEDIIRLLVKRGAYVAHVHVQHAELNNEETIANLLRDRVRIIERNSVVALCDFLWFSQ